MIRIAVFFAALVLPFFSVANATVSSALIVYNVSIVSPERDEVLHGAWVAIRAGKIERIGEGAPPSSADWAGASRIDGAGRYLVPGLIDSHVHLASVHGMPPMVPESLAALAEQLAEQVPRSYLYYGYTTVIDLNVFDPAVITRFQGAPLHPDLYHCGSSLPIANGYPMPFAPEEFRFDAYPNFLYDPAQAEQIPDRYPAAEHTPEQAVQRVADHGGICIKTYQESGFGKLQDLPVLSTELLTDVMQQAHRHDMPVLIHANSRQAHDFVSRSQADIVAHGLWNWNGPELGSELPAEIQSILDRYLQNNVGFMPTMQVIASMRDLLQPDFLQQAALAEVVPHDLIEWYRSDDGQWFAKDLLADFGGNPERAIRIINSIEAQGMQAAAYLARNKGRLLFGTDTPSAPTYANPPGLNGYLEMQHWVEAGISPRQIMEAATRSNAAAFNLGDNYGTVEAGKVANLLLLNANPLKSISAWDQIAVVILNGQAIEREEVANIR